MAFFIYNGQPDHPTGYRVVAFGKAFYKGGNPVEITDNHAINKLTGNPFFFAMTADDVEKSKFNTADIAENHLLDDGEKESDEKPLTASDIDDLSYDELGEYLDENNVQTKPRSTEDRAAALKEVLGLA